MRLRITNSITRNGGLVSMSFWPTIPAQADVLKKANIVQIEQLVPASESMPVGTIVQFTGTPESKIEPAMYIDETTIDPETGKPMLKQRMDETGTKPLSRLHIYQLPADAVKKLPVQNSKLKVVSELAPDTDVSFVLPAVTA